jgi:hypothetical protein
LFISFLFRPGIVHHFPLYGFELITPLALAPSRLSVSPTTAFTTLGLHHFGFLLPTALPSQAGKTQRPFLPGLWFPNAELHDLICGSFWASVC